MSEQY